MSHPDDTTSSGETTIEILRISSIESGSQKYFSSRHRSSEYVDTSRESSSDSPLSHPSLIPSMIHFSRTIRAWGTTLVRGISCVLRKPSKTYMSEYFREKKKNSRNSLGYENILLERSSHLDSEKHIWHGIPISKKYSRDTIMDRRLTSSLKERKRK
jgi:hypothetical protein